MNAYDCIESAFLVENRAQYIATSKPSVSPSNNIYWAKVMSLFEFRL